MKKSIDSLGDLLSIIRHFPEINSHVKKITIGEYGFFVVIQHALSDTKSNGTKKDKTELG